MYKTAMSLTNDDIRNTNIQSLIKTCKDAYTNDNELHKDIKGLKQDYNIMIHELQTGSNKRMLMYNYIYYVINIKLWIPIILWHT